MDAPVHRRPRHNDFAVWLDRHIVSLSLGTTESGENLAVVAKGAVQAAIGVQSGQGKELNVRIADGDNFTVALEDNRVGEVASPVKIDRDPSAITKCCV